MSEVMSMDVHVVVYMLMSVHMLLRHAWHMAENWAHAWLYSRISHSHWQLECMHMRGNALAGNTKLSAAYGAPVGATWLHGSTSRPHMLLLLTWTVPVVPPL
jgi:hypothetical protein